MIDSDCPILPANEPNCDHWDVLIEKITRAYFGHFQDIRVKENSLRIDRGKCMGARLRFPFNQRYYLLVKIIVAHKLHHLFGGLQSMHISHGPWPGLRGKGNLTNNKQQTHLWYSCKMGLILIWERGLRKAFNPTSSMCLRHVRWARKTGEK